MVCRIVYMEPLPFKEQIKVYASSQVLLMTHGAALVNIMFMPKVHPSLSGHKLQILISSHLIVHTLRMPWS